MLVCILIFLIFAIIGVNNFKGTFYACQGDVFSGFNATQIHLIQYPELLQELTSTQRAWIDPVLLNDPKWNSSASVPPSSRIYCESMGASWGPTIPQTFDNVGNGLLTLLEISTTEGWVDVMYSAVDAVGIDMQPIENHSVDGPVLFFLVFMLTGCFFVMNLFVGVLLDNFDRIKKELGENGLLTDAQREWVASMKVISKAMPLRKVPPPENGIRRLCFDMTQNTAFDELIMGCIGVNTITMSLTFIGAPETWDIFLKICNYVFAFIFAVEALLKLTALGFGYFYDDIQFGGIPNIKHHESDALFGVKPPMKDLKKSAAFQLEKLKKLKQKFSGSESKPMSPNHAHHQVIERRKSFSKMSHAELNAIHNDKRHHKMLLKMLKKRSDMDPTKPDIRHVYNLWNCFDFTIVVGTMVGLIFQWTTSGNAGSSVATIAMIIRTFRICRIVRLIKRAKSLRILFNTLILTLPGLANVGSLLFLFLFEIPQKRASGNDRNPSFLQAAWRFGLGVQSWFSSAAPAASLKIQNPWGGTSMGWEILGKSMDTSRICGNSEFGKKSMFENKLAFFYMFFKFGEICIMFRHSLFDAVSNELVPELFVRTDGETIDFFSGQSPILSK